MMIFKQGELNHQITHFTGKNYMQFLATNDDYPHGIANVTFEAGARTDWHAHHFTQALLVTDGEGWLQLKGQAPQLLTAGDSVVIPAETWHWHGATQQSEFIHIAVGADPDPEATEWGEPVRDGDYPRL